MPEFRNVRAEDAIKAFERAGGVARRGKGSHVNVKMPNGQILTISGSRSPLKIGIVRSLIRKSGLSDERFAKLLRSHE
jgi:predicted RNA binding protein YcfA (HicA-like mRNA interferase family)